MDSLSPAPAAAQPSTSPADPVTGYARAVLAGEIVAGPQVRDAAARHLRDLEHGAARGLVWDLDEALHAIGFFSDVLCLNGGEWEGEPFETLPWQQFVIGSVFGWKGPDGTRRFRVGYVETGKGSGKSPLAAGVGLKGLVADGESRAEVYAAATKKDQAMVLFRDAVAMVDMSPELAKRIVKSGSPGNEWNLAYRQTASWFRPIAADDNQSGPRPHMVLVDELHEHRTGNVVELLRAGTKSRQQALIFMITNSGTSRQSVCWSYHEYARKVTAGLLEDDAFFGYVCALDETDDPFSDEVCWEKANPSLRYGIPGLKYLREQVTEARGMPSKEATVRRLNFCQWVDAANPWISGQVWLGAADMDFDAEQLVGRRCFGGLDLSSTTDLTAFTLLFEPTPADPYWRQKTWFWLPGDELDEKERRDQVSYSAWRAAGWLETMPGRAVDKRAVLARLVALQSAYEIVEVGFDRWRIEDFKRLVSDEGAQLPLEAFGQGFKDMAPAVDEYERLLVSGGLKHDGNPVLTWNAASAVVETDPAGNRKVTKRRATGRVDGIVAAVMAAGTHLRHKQPEEVFLERW